MKNRMTKRTMEVKRMGETLRERVLRLWKNQNGDSESTGTVVLIIGALVVGAILIGLLVALFRACSHNSTYVNTPNIFQADNTKKAY